MGIRSRIRQGRQVESREQVVSMGKRRRRLRGFTFNSTCGADLSSFDTLLDTFLDTHHLTLYTLHSTHSTHLQNGPPQKRLQPQKQKILLNPPFRAPRRQQRPQTTLQSRLLGSGTLRPEALLGQAIDAFWDYAGVGYWAAISGGYCFVRRPLF